jgi:glycosyltransferase involved in cell wall biosynthesis
MTTIALDARAASEEPAGRGRVLRELLQAMNRKQDSNRYLLYARSRWSEQLDGRFEWRIRRLPDPIWHLWAALDGSRRAEAFLSTNSYLTAWFTWVPTALVVYDTIAWDAPESAQRRAQRIERATARLGLRRAKVAICISEATRRDLVARFPSAAPKSTVVPLAAADRFRELPERERSDFVLCVGTLEPRKNLVRAIQAHGELPPELRRLHPLVIAGATGWEQDEILSRAAEAGALIKTDVTDAELAELYATCAVFLFPSLYEGFGLPLLEAMAAGAACVTSLVTSLPEVGRDAVRYVDPTKVDEIRDALADLLANPAARAALGRQARERAAAFSWDRTAAEIVGQLEALASTRS